MQRNKKGGFIGTILGIIFILFIIVVIITFLQAKSTKEIIDKYKTIDFQSLDCDKLETINQMKVDVETIKGKCWNPIYANLLKIYGQGQLNICDDTAYNELVSNLDTIQVTLQTNC